MTQQIKKDKSYNTLNQKCDCCHNNCPCQIESSIENHIKPKDFDKHTMATIKMSQKAYRKMMYYICSRPAESGGILLGPVGTNEVTDFYFDRKANCSAVTYTPDHVTLNKKMKEDWLPAGIDMKGFAHSHSSCLDRLSSGDLSYIKRFLNKNSDMDMFIAPVIIPEEYRMRPMFVAKQNYYQPREARIELF
jgi:proteasome lid subunit RPN8/RPN11